MIFHHTVETHNVVGGNQTNITGDKVDGNQTIVHGDQYNLNFQGPYGSDTPFPFPLRSAQAFCAIEHKSDIGKLTDNLIRVMIKFAPKCFIYT